MLIYLCITYYDDTETYVNSRSISCGYYIRSRETDEKTMLYLLPIGVREDRR